MGRKVGVTGKATARKLKIKGWIPQSDPAPLHHSLYMVVYKGLGTSHKSPAENPSVEGELPAGKSVLRALLSSALLWLSSCKLH